MTAVQSESSDVDHLDGETSVDGREAKNYGPIPLFADDAAIQIDALKSAHGFNPDFDLLMQLRHIRYELRDWFGYDAIAAKKKRLFVKKISHHATAMLALFHSPHDDELAHLAGEDAGRPYEKKTKSAPGAISVSESELAPGIELARISERLARLGPDLLWIADRAQRANERKAPRGRPHDHLLENLIRSIRRVYVETFGKEAARITKADEFSGAFFNFVVAVLPLFGEKVPPNNTLGSLVVDACAWFDAEPVKKV